MWRLFFRLWSMVDQFFIKKVFVYELVFPIDEGKIFFFLYKIPRINFFSLY